MKTIEINPPAPLVGAHGCGPRSRPLVYDLWSGVVLSAVSCPTDLRQVVLLTFVKWSVFEDQQSVLFT